jgi:hypothetical protein
VSVMFVGLQNDCVDPSQICIPNNDAFPVLVEHLLNDRSDACIKKVTSQPFVHMTHGMRRGTSCKSTELSQSFVPKRALREHSVGLT